MSDVMKMAGHIGLASTIVLSPLSAVASDLSQQLSVVFDRSKPERTRITAAKSVAKSGAREAVIPLVQALQNTKGSLKAAIRKALEDLEATKVLLEDLGHEDPAVRKRGAELLGVWQDPASLPKLVAHLEDPQAAVREESATAIARFGGKDQVEALAKALRSDEVSDVRMAAAQALGQIDAPAAKAALTAALATEKDEYVLVFINMGLKGKK